MADEQEKLYVFGDDTMTLKQATEELEARGDTVMNVLEVASYRTVTLKRRVEIDIEERKNEDKKR